jgi:hypothetical protein
MDILWVVLLAALGAIQWLIQGFIAAVSNPMYWAGLVVGTGGGWILGRGWPRPESSYQQADDWDEDEWDEDEWDDDEAWEIDEEWDEEYSADDGRRP